MGEMTMTTAKVLKLLGYKLEGKDSNRPRYARAGEIRVWPNGVPSVDRDGRTKATKGQLKDEISVLYESTVPLEENDLLQFDGRYHKVFRLRSHRVLPGAARQIADVVVLRPDTEILMGSPEDEG